MKEYVFLRKDSGGLDCYEVYAPHSDDLLSLPDNAGGVVIDEKEIAELIESIRVQIPGNRLHKTPIALGERFAVRFDEAESILKFLEERGAV